MQKFNQVYNKYQEQLALYVPTVARVHGPSHPVFYEVAEIYNQLLAKLVSKESLSEEFKSLRQLTNNYQIPDDVCETYAAVYNILSEMDQEYSD